MIAWRCEMTRADTARGSHATRPDATLRAKSVGRTTAGFDLGRVEAKAWASTQGPPNALGRVDERLLQPQVKGLGEEPRGLGLRQYFEPRVDCRLDRALVQQVGTETVDGSDLRLLEMRDGVIEVGRRAVSVPRALELFAKTKLELASRLLRERHGQDLVHGERIPTEEVDDPSDQLGGLSGPRSGFDDQALIERTPDALPGRLRRPMDGLPSEHSTECVEVDKLRLVFPRHSSFLPWTANVSKIAPFAGTLPRRG